MTSILLVKTSAIGDVIQTFPVLEYLRQKFPHAEIDWVVEEGIAPLLRAHPFLSNVIGWDLKKWRKRPFSSDTLSSACSFYRTLRAKQYDYLFDLQGNTKSVFVTLFAKAKVKVGFDAKGVRERLNLLATHCHISVPSQINRRLKYLKLVQNYFGDAEEFLSQGVHLTLSHDCQLPKLSRDKRYMICFGSKWPNKQLKKSSLIPFLETIEGHFYFVYGDLREKQMAEELAAHFPGRAELLGEMSLPLWQAVMWEMDGIIASDSAGLHLAGTTGTPTLSFFGPTRAETFKPLEARHRAIQGVCPYGISFEEQCPKLRSCPTGACMQIETQNRSGFPQE
ncbi:MAG: hypothetical protein JSS61_02910 [Verrucomicrobia bacterium]|nr:hypothetical protein [Verrucomicrobiota bacterium]